MARHILVLGATGPSGIAFCRAALRKDRILTLYVRTPSKLPKEIAEHRDVTVIQGTFDNADKLAEAAACGATVMVSLAGPLFGQKGSPITDCYRLLLPRLAEHRYERVLVLSTPSFRAPEDTRNLKISAMVVTVKLLQPAVYADIVGASRLVANRGNSAPQGASDVEGTATVAGDEPVTVKDPKDGSTRIPEVSWTLFRVPGLLNGAPKTDSLRAGFVGSGQDGIFLRRESLAEWLLKEIEERNWVGRAPLVSD